MNPSVTEILPAADAQSRSPRTALAGLLLRSLGRRNFDSRSTTWPFAPWRRAADEVIERQL